MILPLAGKRVVNTRSISQAGELDRLLAEHGAIPFSFPCISIQPPADVGNLDAAIDRLVGGGFDWVVFTSANTVEAVAGRLGSHPERSEGSTSSGANVAVVGPVSGDAVARFLGWPVAFVSDVERAADLGSALPVAPGDRVLLPKSALAGPALAAILNGRGAVVTEVVAYETTTGAGGVDLASLLAADEVDAVCFTSGSTVRGCLERLNAAALPDGIRVACMGTETAAVARSLGIGVDVVPAQPAARAMVEALAASFAKNDR